jgi:hypothetical protein
MRGDSLYESPRIVWKLFSIGKETFAGLPFFLKIYFG